MSKAKAQKFEMQTMRRSQINKAAYNPREMDDAARKKLTDSIKRVGLLEPLVVNRRTGNLVSGHQRLDILDALQGRTDYELDVAMVDLDPKSEKEQNAFMNNELAQGTFDIAKLSEVLKVADYEFCGFDPGVLEAMVPGWKRPSDEAPAPVAAAQETCDVILVFPDRAETDRFMELLRLSKDEKYITGELVADLVKRARSAASVTG